MLRLTNSIATVRGDANLVDAAADAMDQIENCDNPNNTQEVDTEEEDDTQN